MLVGLPDDLTSAMKLAMELFEMVDEADPLNDSSYIDQPSISPHDQNTGHRDWTAFDPTAKRFLAGDIAGLS